MFLESAGRHLFRRLNNSQVTIWPHKHEVRWGLTHQQTEVKRLGEYPIKTGSRARIVVSFAIGNRLGHATFSDQ